MDDLAERLRKHAIEVRTRPLATHFDGVTAELLCLAADHIGQMRISGPEHIEEPEWCSDSPPAEAVESETAPTIDLPWPLIPMPQDYPTMVEYTAAMVEWGKRVFEVEGAKP